MIDFEPLREVVGVWRECVGIWVELLTMIEENVERDGEGKAHAHGPQAFYDLVERLKALEAKKGVAADPSDADPAVGPGQVVVERDDLLLVLEQLRIGYASPDTQAAMRRMLAAASCDREAEG